MNVADIGKHFSAFNLTEDNVLDFMISKDDYYSTLLKRYIISQLEIRYHLYGLTSSLDYKGNDEEPLIQILKGNEPFLWKKIIDIDRNSKPLTASTSDLFYEIQNKVNLIYLTNFKYPKEISDLKRELDQVSKFDILKQKKLEKKIESVKRTIFNTNSDIMQYQPHPYDYSDKDVINKKATDWINFYQNNIVSFMREHNYSEKIDPSVIRDYLYDKSFILDRIYNLKQDLLLNYKLITCAYNNSNQTQSLDDILLGIRTILNQYGGHLGEVRMTTNYRALDLQVSSLSSPFFQKTTKGIDVKDEMDQLSKQYEKIKTIDDNQSYVQKCIQLFQDFIRIHPYSEGNGRTSRYMLDAMLTSRNIVPPILYDTYRHRFLLDKASDEYIINGDSRPIESLIFAKINDVYETQSKCIKSKDDLAISSKIK